MDCYVCLGIYLTHCPFQLCGTVVPVIESTYIAWRAGTAQQCKLNVLGKRLIWWHLNLCAHTILFKSLCLFFSKLTTGLQLRDLIEDMCYQELRQVNIQGFLLHARLCHVPDRAEAPGQQIYLIFANPTGYIITRGQHNNKNMYVK